MKVVIAGAWNRPEQADILLVNNLIDQLAAGYPKLHIISGGCDRGVGKIVKNRCMPKSKGQDADPDFLEIQFKIYWADPSKSELAQVWIARNAAFVEIGEEFHIFADVPGGSGGGAMADLQERVEKAGLPYSLYIPGKDKEPKMLNGR